MKNRIVLNFKNALLLLISIKVVYLIIYVTFSLLFENGRKNNSSLIFFEYVSILLYIPFIFWIVKKTGTNFKDYLFIPDLSILIKMIAIVVLAQAIVLSPLSHFDAFLKSLMNSKLRVLSTTTRPLFPLLDLRMLLIIPIIEELFFRGLILKNFLKRYSPIYAILLSSLLFSVHHLSIDRLIFYILLGTLFGVLYYTSNSLIIVILAHIIWNTFTVFSYEYIDLILPNSIIYLLIYVIACIGFIFLLRNDLKKFSRRDSINSINE